MMAVAHSATWLWFTVERGQYVCLKLFASRGGNVKAASRSYWEVGGVGWGVEQSHFNEPRVLAVGLLCESKKVVVKVRKRRWCGISNN